MRWYTKCALDNLKGLVPARDVFRKYKRRLVPYRSSAGRANLAIQEGIQLIDFIRSSREITGAVCLEIGTGWEILIPVLFSLCGAKQVILTDLHRLCSDETVASAITALKRNRHAIATGLGLDTGIVDRRLASAPNRLGDFLSEFRLEYLAPCDCAALPIPDSSVDIVYSRAVLEHIHPAVLEAIFRESRRVLDEAGLSCHFIDPSDHWQHGDQRISRINFLRYSDGVFRWTYLNSLNYQNRLRHSEYVRLFERSGFEIIREHRTVDRDAVQFARTARLAAKFRHFAPEDLATVDSFFLARPRRG